MTRAQVLISLLLLAAFPNGATSECTMDDEQCEFWLEISHRLTMMYGRDAVYPYHGKLYKYDVPESETNVTEPISPDDVVLADGWEGQRLVVVANGTMPAPPIEVYEGQTIVVHVSNHMASAPVTIHWHGLHQSGTPWMDGVAFITQCPIESGQSFTYRFKAYPKGTFWYHSHIGAQLGQGMVGAFIIREKKPLPMPEHIMLLQDWNHDWDADMTHMRMEFGSYTNRTKQVTTDSLDNGHFSNFLFHSGLINGRGRYSVVPNSAQHAPLTVYQVEHGTSNRFRVIGAGNLYPFRVSVDGHKMALIASDGFDLEPVMLESFVINPGERFDFVITANQTVDNYWIRAESLEINVVNHIALAILRYNESSTEDPTSQRMICTANETCIVANCPFSYYPFGSHTQCLTFDDLKAAEHHRTPGATAGKDEEIEEMFLNFAFPGVIKFPGSVNGIKFKKPPSPALTQPKDIPTFCSDDEYYCPEQEHCYCTSHITLEHNKVYQMVLLNMGAGRGWSHPIHMHGHSYHVVKMGYPSYNQTTGVLLGPDNSDISCPGHPDATNSFCNVAQWSNSSWKGNDIPGLELDRPPIKDTLIIPTGGYAIIRIRADNPGAWFMHCHIELHNLDGMATMLNESYELQKPPPADFPKCGNFRYDSVSTPPAEPMPTTDDDDDDCKDDVTFWLVVGILIGVCVIQFIVIICMAQRDRPGDSGKNPTDPAKTTETAAATADAAENKQQTFDNPAYVL